MDLQLAGRSALVTGASSGIGRGIVKALAAEGVRTVAVARRRDLLESLAEEVAAAGHPRPGLVLGDLTTPGGPEGAAQEALRLAGGRIDILVNNAGQSHPVTWQSDDEVWTHSMELNFHAPRRLAQALIPAMKAAGWGRILTVTGGQELAASNAASAAKAAAQAWSKGLAAELGRDGITVNCVVPGRINSEQILNRLHPDEAEREAFIQRAIPLGYFGEPADFAAMVAFLASPLARYVTGEAIRVDGGMLKFAH